VTTFVYDFHEGSKDDKDLLGGKGANLAEMTNMGLPVPPGFTITTAACNAYLQTGALPEGLSKEVEAHLRTLETDIGRRLGDADDPLLVSVRSGARFSMPGMMDTVLNIGLNDDTVAGLARRADERFAFDSYRRLIQMFAVTVQGVDGELFTEAIEEQKQSTGASSETELSADDCRRLVDRFRSIVRDHTGADFPQDPHEQLRQAILAVFDSWNSPRAVLYRRQERIPADAGTAVNVCSMVFGNLGMDSGTGVAFTRDPASGAQGVYGDYLQNAQGEDVVAGTHNTVPLHELRSLNRQAYDELMDIMVRLERHFLDLCDIEFTIENGKLWMLQTRVGKRTAGAAFRIAAQLVDEGLIDLDEALRRVSGEQLSQLMFPAFDETATRERIAKGLNAAPGAATGYAVFSSAQAVAWAEDGKDVILVRRETNPDDLEGMIAATGILTSRGGKTSHAAVVARSMGRTCVCGIDDLVVDYESVSFTTGDGRTIREGDVISIDGTTGDVYVGEVPVVDSAVVQYFNGDWTPDRSTAGPSTDSTDEQQSPAADTHTREVVAAVDLLMRHADARARMHVRANADTSSDALRARTYGAQGIGLCRTEHMFLGDRRHLIERLVIAESEREQQRQLDALLDGQRSDFAKLFEAMDGLPTTIRLLDPPLHEFLPDLTELSVKVAVADLHHKSANEDRKLLKAVRRLHEANPMIGLRGVRLGIVIPGLFTMQARAILEAAAERKLAGGDPRVEIMIPLVSAVQELEAVRQSIIDIAEEVQRDSGVDLDYLVGTMIELPRAALTANQIAESAEFFSFGTNDLTQMTWGFSRDDVETSFFSKYLEMGIFGISPFESVDVDGVGELVRTAVERGRHTRPDLHLGVCGEHGGDPASVRFFDSAGLDYVSCSPFRVPVARLEAARAVVLNT